MLQRCQSLNTWHLFMFLQPLISNSRSFSRPESPVISFNAAQFCNSRDLNVVGNSPTSTSSLQKLTLRRWKLGQKHSGNNNYFILVPRRSKSLSRSMYMHLHLSIEESSILCPLGSANLVSKGISLSGRTISCTQIFKIVQLLDTFWQMIYSCTMFSDVNCFSSATESGKLFKLSQKLSANSCRFIRLPSEAGSTFNLVYCNFRIFRDRWCLTWEGNTSMFPQCERYRLSRVLISPSVSLDFVKLVQPDMRDF